MHLVIFKIFLKTLILKFSISKDNFKDEKLIKK